VDKSDIVEAVLEQARDVDGKKKLDCAQALKLAAVFKTGPAEVGRICNERNIRIRRCQLGCFK